MGTSRFTEEQITLALRQAEAGTPVVEICRKLEITENTFYRWKRRYGGLGVSELRELRDLRDENRRLKRGRRSHARQTDPAGVAPKKILTPAQRRSWVAWVQEVFCVSSRAACCATGVGRSFIAYGSRRPPQDALRRRLRELAAARVSYG